MAARAAFEISVKAAWLVDAADPFERERRWLAHYTTEEDYLRRQIRELESLNADTSASKNRLDTLTTFREEVASALAARGYGPPAAVPNFRELLRSIGEERTYGLYMMLSQTAHASHSSTWLYRSGGVGTEKKDGEFVSPDQWNVPLALCRFAFKKPAVIVLSRLGADTARLMNVIG
jgi:hypothetical protein